MKAALALVDEGAGSVIAPPTALTAAATAGAVGVVATPVTDVPERLEQAWQELAEDAAEPNSFGEPWFAGTGLRNLAAENEVTLIEAWLMGVGEPLLLGVLLVCIGADYGRMRVRHLRNWRHFHNFLGTPLIRAGHERSFWSAVLAHLDEARWAPGFFHLNGITEHGPVHSGLQAAAHATGRPCATVHGELRAELRSDLSPQDYYERNVRKKKRKEIQRLTNRLAELGTVTTRHLDDVVDLGRWCDAFLDLERSGWKGTAGSALACSPGTDRFFREAVAGAFAAGRLDFLRMDLDGRPIAMLVNFLAAPGSFSFKIAFDEAYARFSPGVLIQRENLGLLARGDIDWMDSCAAEDHPMIESLWGERRAIVRVSVPLKGIRRRLTYAACRTLERAGAVRRRLLRRFANA